MGGVAYMIMEQEGHGGDSDRKAVSTINRSYLIHSQDLLSGMQ